MVLPSVPPLLLFGLLGRMGVNGHFLSLLQAQSPKNRSHDMSHSPIRDSTAIILFTIQARASVANSCLLLFLPIRIQPPYSPRTLALPGRESITFISVAPFTTHADGFTIPSSLPSFPNSISPSNSHSSTSPQLSHCFPSYPLSSQFVATHPAQRNILTLSTLHPGSLCYRFWSAQRQHHQGEVIKHPSPFS